MAKNLPKRITTTDAVGTVLLAFADQGERDRAQDWLEDAGYVVVLAETPAEAVEIIGKRLTIDVVVAETPFCTTQDSALIAAQDSPRGLEVIMAGPSDVFVVTQALAAGAVSFLPHPLTHTDLMVQVLRAVQRARTTLIHENHLLSQPKEVDFEGIVGATPRMTQIMDLVRKAGPTDAPMVILGDSGTGKELIARAIHNSNPHTKRGQFVAVHLSATPQGLLESELFGHTKGAFTGALADRTGKLELANGGTLFLDELGDIPLDTQSKLLRVLETHTFEPIGSNREVHSDFRVIAATNQDIEQLIEERKFREELWYRLKIIVINLPTLNERRADIPLLAGRFAKEFGTRYRKQIDGIDPDVLAVFAQHDWKGNIRELRNLVQHMVVLTEDTTLTLRDVPRDLRGSGSGEGPAPAGDLTLAGRTMEDIEEAAIRETLKQTGGNRKATAQLLEIGERTLYRKIEKYGL